MNERARTLINGYLDGVLTESDEAALNDWLKAAPQNAAAFAKAARLHDRLHVVVRAERTVEPVHAAVPTAVGRRPGRWRRLTLTSGLLAVVVVGMALFWWGSPPRVTAAAELDRLINAAGPGDRVYRITSLDPNPLPIEPRQAPIDGALLYVGPPDRYVLVRRFPDGRPYVTGFDGERNWAAPPDGAVRLSHDPLRFRWALPGHQHGIPFADLRSDLVELRDAYQLTPLPTDAVGRRGLLAVKKSSDYRGPNRVELWYDRDTGVIHRMVFAGLPKARGGPNSVAVDLVDRRDLGPDFFKHQTHHAPDRRIVEED